MSYKLVGTRLKVNSQDRLANEGFFGGLFKEISGIVKDKFPGLSSSKKKEVNSLSIPFFIRYADDLIKDIDNYAKYYDKIIKLYKSSDFYKYADLYFSKKIEDYADDQSALVDDFSDFYYDEIYKKIGKVSSINPVKTFDYYFLETSTRLKDISQLSDMDKIKGVEECVKLVKKYNDVIDKFTKTYKAKFNDDLFSTIMDSILTVLYDKYKDQVIRDFLVEDTDIHNIDSVIPALCHDDKDDEGSALMTLDTMVLIAEKIIKENQDITQEGVLSRTWDVIKLLPGSIYDDIKKKINERFNKGVNLDKMEKYKREHENFYLAYFSKYVYPNQEIIFKDAVELKKYIDQSISKVKSISLKPIEAKVLSFHYPDEAVDYIARYYEKQLTSYTKNGFVGRNRNNKFYKDLNFKFRILPTSFGNDITDLEPYREQNKEFFAKLSNIFNIDFTKTNLGSVIYGYYYSNIYKLILENHRELIKNALRNEPDEDFEDSFEASMLIICDAIVGTTCDVFFDYYQGPEDNSLIEFFTEY